MRSDLLLLDTVLAGAPPTPRERDYQRMALENELRDVETQLNLPSHGDRITEERVRGEVNRFVREATAEENTRWRRAAATVPLNLQTGRVDAVRQMEVEREHQAALQRIHDLRPEVERETRADLTHRREVEWRNRRAGLTARKTQIASRLRELGT